MSLASLPPSLRAANEAPQYDTQKVLGWTLNIDQRLTKDSHEATEKAVKLLKQQLEEVVRVVPPTAVSKLREVPLWFSPEYPGIGPRAEYHPDKGWLVDNHRNPEMAKAIEFTNIRIFEQELKRMPNFALHELAHAYHDRVLGFENPTIEAAYQRAKTAGIYDNVERSPGDGRPNVKDKAYAMVNAKEYFAETSEAFFSRNDFYPFNREELDKHDPEMSKVLDRFWYNGLVEVPASKLPPPPAELKVSPFYKKYVSAHGYPIVASAKVNDYALFEAAFLVDLMLAKRPDVREAMIKSDSRLCIIAHNEFTTDLPEWSHFEPKLFWDARARGTGGSSTDPHCSCGEENLLAYEGDPYSTECILIHEFAHNIHLRGMPAVDPTFDTRVKGAYDAAMAAGLWKGKYASVNHHEYFAEGVQSWFDNNREPDHDHNHVNTRAELIEYDPKLADLCREIFGDTELKYTKPTTRLKDHLSGYDPKQSPKFVWPQHLLAEKDAIRKKALERNKAAESASPQSK